MATNETPSIIQLKSSRDEGTSTGECLVPQEILKERPAEETTVEQTPDGSFRRQRNTFTAKFGATQGAYPVEAGRYHVLGALGCGWNRRQRIVLRLLGLNDIVIPEVVYGRDAQGWKLTVTPGSVGERYGYTRLNDFYRATDPEYTGRGTSPTVVDITTGKVVTNNYHLLPIQLETDWKPLHKQGAPDLYPATLRPEINLLNQQLFDDVNNGTYKVIFATNQLAARAAYNIFKARLEDYNFRLSSRRYLFGPYLTDSDVRLFQTLESFEHSYRPRIVETLATDDVLHIWDYPNLWGYARDLFQTSGFIDDAELFELGYVPNGNGEYVAHDLVGGASDETAQQREEEYGRWLEPADRDQLEGSPYYSGPGVGGSYELWEFGPFNNVEPPIATHDSSVKR